MDCAARERRLRATSHLGATSVAAVTPPVSQSFAAVSGSAGPASGSAPRPPLSAAEKSGDEQDDQHRRAQHQCARVRQRPAAAGRGGVKGEGAGLTGHRSGLVLDRLATVGRARDFVLLDPDRRGGTGAAQT